MDYYTTGFGKRAKSWTAFAIILIIAAIFAATSLSFYVDYIEIKELGEKFTSVFMTNLTIKVISSIISFIVVFLIFYINTIVVKNIMAKRGGPLADFIAKPLPKVIISLAFSIIASKFISETIFNRYLLFANSVDFGVQDPLFGNDIGYYIFTRPFLTALLNSFMSIWLIAIIYCVLFYAIINAVNGLLNFERLICDRPVIIHNIFNISVYFVLKAITYRFTSEEILYSSIGDVAGAGYTDIYVWFNFYKIAPFLLSAIVIAAIIFTVKRKYTRAVVSVAVYPAILILVSITAFFVQTIIVTPNEAVKEKPYYQHNINYTKLAYNLNNISEVEFSANNTLLADDLIQNSQSLESTRIIDFQASLTAYNSLQGIRNFYKFTDSDIGKYNIAGKENLYSVAARELDKESLDDSAKTYANEVFRFTHGFGAVMSPVNEVTSEGQPKFLIKNIPPVSSDGAPHISQPRIYYGEEADDEFVIVNSTLKEIDYLEGAEDAEFSYDGAGGIKLSWFNRLLYSVKYADFRMLISEFITSDSKILINRDIKDRVEKAVPFLKFDSDPCLVISDDGRLKWVIDGYTTSQYYPYSQPYDDINYIRNSVKAVLDAYDGTIDLYVIDKKDPIIQSYMKIYPEIFTKNNLPATISDHIIYPEYLFKIQAEIYGKYHVTNVNSFYNKSDTWVFSKEKYGKETRSVEPYYNMLNISGAGDDPEFVAMIPYTLSNKENMVAFLTVNCEYDNYGNFVAYKFPKNKNIYGTLQIESRIDNDPEISKEMTLWGQGGSNVTRGNMLVVPIKDSVLYIEPIYISSDSKAAIPELKRVAVAYNNKIVMEPTLEKALAVIFEGDTPSGPVAEFSNEDLISDSSADNETITDSTSAQQDQTVDINHIADKIIKSYENVKQSSKDGDWEKFGKNMNELDKAVENLKKSLK